MRSNQALDRQRTSKCSAFIASVHLPLPAGTPACSCRQNSACRWSKHAERFALTPGHHASWRCIIPRQAGPALRRAFAIPLLADRRRSRGLQRNHRRSHHPSLVLVLAVDRAGCTGCAESGREAVIRGEACHLHRFGRILIRTDGTMDGMYVPAATWNRGRCTVIGGGRRQSQRRS